MSYDIFHNSFILVPYNSDAVEGKSLREIAALVVSVTATPFACLGVPGLDVCVYVRVCVRARARACVCACA